MNTARAYPGIYLALDPRPSRAQATVERMLRLAGELDGAVLAVEGPGFALAAVAPPGVPANTSPELHQSERGTLILVGDTADARRDLYTSSCFELASFLRGLNGSFAGAWFDVQDQSWTIFNDRWGLIPLFWWAQGPRLIVSPKARLTWLASESKLRVDGNGVADLLRTQNMLDDHTLIEGVHWLEPATLLRGDGRQARTRRYWDYQHAPRAHEDYDQVLDRFVEASRATITRMTDTPAPILQGLSGGLDSRLFLAVCGELGRVPHCYTSGFAYSEDLRFGRKLARAAGAPHDAIILDENTLPAQLRASIIETDGLHGAGHLAMSAPIVPYLAHHREAVLIEGYLHGVLGGSDLPDERDVPADRPPHQHAWAVDFLHSGGEPAAVNVLLHDGLAVESLWRWQAHVDDAFARAQADDGATRAEYAIITGRSGRNDVLVPAMFRRHVLARHPACDRRMMEWFAATPARYRRARRVYIDVLRKRYPRLARVPRADGCSGMPLADGRWRREFHWQVEKLYSCWARLRYPQVRKWGRHSTAARLWTLDACSQAGLFDAVLAPDARVLEWVRPEALRRLWAAVDSDPRQSVPLLSLLTIESMIRELQRPAEPPARPLRLAFQRIAVAPIEQRSLAEVP